MLLPSYYAQNYAVIIGSSLIITTQIKVVPMMQFSKMLALCYCLCIASYCFAVSNYPLSGVQMSISSTHA